MTVPELNIADWPPLIPAVLVAVAALWVPGLAVVAAATRLRLWTIALAPAVSVGLIAVSGIIWGFLGAAWSWSAVAVMTVVVAAVAFVVRRLLKADGGGPMPTRAAWRWAAGGFVVASGILAVQMVRAIGTPDAISQTFDAIFHLNAVQHVVQSGNASAFGLTDFTGNGFYPMGWHALTSIVVEVAGVSIPQAITATNIAIAATAWPAGCLALGAVALPRVPWAPAAAAVASAGFGAFPFRLITFGVIYPNFLSMALLPAVLAGATRVLGLPWTASRTNPGERWMRILLLLVAGAGLGLAQPIALMSLLIMSLPLFLYAAVCRVRAQRKAGQTRSARLTVVGAALVVVAFLVVWHVARPPAEAATWGPTQTVGNALGLALTGSPPSGIIAWAIAIPLLAGFVVFIRRPGDAWAVGPFVVAVILYTFASAQPTTSQLRMFLTGVYFNDTVRVAALIPVGAVVTFTIGAAAIVGILCRWTERQPGVLGLWARRLRPAGAVVLCVALVGGIALENGNTEAEIMRSRRAYAPSGPLLTTAERTLLERLPDLTPPDALVLGNPNTGTALAFALGDRVVTEPHVFSTPSTQVIYLNGHLNAIDTNPAVCAAATAAGVDYVLDFGTKGVLPWKATTMDYSGLEGLQPGPHLELVASEGRAARLFRVSC
ncbi:DUF6541 family protein [Xylanimonas sp. McL0601]|uniref:DUF6541 family protein n=1 Tax=Xylanimonas sp. McL0601 TaxID=3414739 RepID=UPI003CEA3927